MRVDIRGLRWKVNRTLLFYASRAETIGSEAASSPARKTLVRKEIILAEWKMEARGDGC